MEQEKSIKPKAKKRVLKPLINNSLLLPLGSLKKSSTAPHLMQDNPVIEETQPKAARPRSVRKASKPALRTSSYSDWEEDPFNDGSDGLSDFVIDDEASLSEADSDSDFGSPPPPPPKSTRKLVRGRRPENKSPPAAMARPRSQPKTLKMFEKQENATKAKITSMRTIVDLMSAIDLLTSEDEAPQKPTLSKPRMRSPKDEVCRPGTSGTSSGFDEPLPNLRL